jgi:hypothetical protein
VLVPADIGAIQRVNGITCNKKVIEMGVILDYACIVVLRKYPGHSLQ